MMTTRILLAFTLLGSVVSLSMQQPLEPLIKFRQTHRKTTDGRLCAGAYVHNSQAYTDCTTAANPEGVSDREWCYVEEQAASAGPQKWDYCAPKINYADVRKRVQHAFAEKAYEVADATAAVLSLSKEGATLMEEIRAQCS
jgi:hypothetical protein